MLLISIPVLLIFTPFALIGEWFADKADAIENDRQNETRAQIFAENLRRLPPPAPLELTLEELAELKRKTREGSEKSAAYLANYFGPEGPRKPKPVNKYARRGRARPRY